MAKFKELQLGQQVRLVSSNHTALKYGYIANPMLEVGAVGTITDLHTSDKVARLDGEDFVYHHKDLEIVSEPEPVAPKELTLEDFVVTRVRVKSTGAKGTVIGAADGAVLVQHDEDKHSYHDGVSGTVARGRANACWWYTPSDLEIITEEV